MTRETSWERQLLSAWGRRSTLFEDSRTLIEASELFCYLCELGKPGLKGRLLPLATDSNRPKEVSQDDRKQSQAHPA